MDVVHTPYRGSTKHKARPARGAKGTNCPEWTHWTDTGNLRTDMFSHDWASTAAARLFSEAVVDEVSGRRYATGRGIAFQAKETNDGTWHGYPVPWESVPPNIVERWRQAGLVNRQQIRRFLSFDRSDLDWPLETDR